MNLSDPMDDDPSIHCLEASAPTTGGLVLKKDSSKNAIFKIPKPSLLGLDTLAAQKRREREEAKRLISFKDSEYDDNNEGSTVATPSGSRDSGFKTPDTSSHHKLNRQYRAGKVETPSHTGGVSDKARNRLLEHAAEKDKRGVYVSSKDRKRNRDDDRDNHRSYYNRERDRNRDNDDRRRDRNDRRRSRSSGRNNDSLRRERSSDSERSLHTPRFRDEPKTPKGIITSLI